MIDTASEKELEIVCHLFEVSQKNDWWNEISPEQRRVIDKGLQQLDRGEGILHDVVMKKHAKWLKK